MVKWVLDHIADDKHATHGTLYEHLNLQVLLKLLNICFYQTVINISIAISMDFLFDNGKLWWFSLIILNLKHKQIHYWKHHLLHKLADIFYGNYQNYIKLIVHQVQGI